MDAISPRRRQRADPTLKFISKHELWNQVALQCGITPEAVRAWRRVPKAQVRNVEIATGRPAYMIRPDLHDRPLIQHQ